ncbi:hypothetical protein [Halofilum ochraceum]|uniref:hypothetical protein n=1 Tax=Halofilum ochraceum TaxID=1611323 RepID=UPI0008DA6B42|nr:hypothetical protein [Halofilum ochraceum]
MRKLLRGFAVGLLVGGLVGLWFGMNIGKGQPLLSNPFARVTLSERLDRTMRQAAEETGTAVDKAGDAVREGAETVKEELQSE